MTEGVVLNNVTHAYGKTIALQSLSLTIRPASQVAIVGPDGVGKSTALGLISGAKRLQKGELSALGANFAKARERLLVEPRIAYMPQGLGRNLYPNLTVGENVDFFARLFGHNAKERTIRGTRLLEATGLLPFKDRLMSKLSGGMKQKLGLCTSLVHDPDLLLLDEPTTGVDPLSRREFWELIAKIRQERPQLTVITATSDMDEADGFDRVVMMDAGRILADGAPQALKSQCASPSLEAAFISLMPPEKLIGYQATGPRPPLEETRDMAIEAHGLTRRFGNFTAVDHIDLAVSKGEIFGFLGSNGCGKSTTMKMLTGLLPASEGEAFLFSRPLTKTKNTKDRSKDNRRRVGYMSQSFSLYGELSVAQNLNLHAAIFDLEDKQASTRMSQLVERFGLKPFLDQIAESLTLGARQRLQLAVALLHEPDILILDEPTSGVDPIARDIFWNNLVDLSRHDGVTIFISTHFMSEAERCDRIAFMHAGKIIATGAPEALKTETKTQTLDEAFITFMKKGGRNEAIKEEDAAKSDESTEQVNAQPPHNPVQMARSTRFSLQRLLAYSRRETMELMRDRIRLGFALLGTALLMLIFGYGLTLDVDHLTFGVLDRDQTAESRAFIDAFAASPAFTRGPDIADQNGLETMLRANQATLAIEIPEKFGADLRAGKKPDVLVTLDGAMPFRAETALGYVSGASQIFVRDLARLQGQTVTTPASVIVRYRYNQGFESIKAMVPAVIGLLLVFIPAILTALGVVSEKEMGSISNLYVTPVTKLEFLLGKQLPYIGIGFINFLTLVFMAVFIFGVPLQGSALGLALAAFVYVGATTAIGIFSSTFTKTQVAALFVTAIGVMMPATQFSGLLQPVATLDGAGKIIGELFPTTYFMRASVGAFTKSLRFDDLLGFIWPLALAWLFTMAASWLFLQKQER